MVNTKFQYILFPPICILSTFLLAYPQESKRLRVVSETIVCTVPPGFAPSGLYFRVSPQGYMVQTETDSEYQKVYLINIYDLRQRRLLERFPRNIRVESRFISYGSYVLIYYTQTKNMWSSKIYEAKIQDTDKPYWSSEGIHTASASVSPRSGEILYEVRNDSPEIYLTSKKQVARFISSGMGAQWSPDGRWFLTRHLPAGYRSNPKERFRKGQISKEQFEKENEERRYQQWKWPLTFFDTAGNEVLRLNEFSGRAYWSPNSNKLLYEEYGKKGFSVIDLEFSLTHPHFKSLFHYEGPNVPSKQGWFEEMDVPGSNQWSPGGTNIIFMRDESEGHIAQNYSIWIFNVTDKSAYELTKRSESYVEAMWATDGSILVYADSKIIRLDLKQSK